MAEQDWVGLEGRSRLGFFLKKVTRVFLLKKKGEEGKRIRTWIDRRQGKPAPDSISRGKKREWLRCEPEVGQEEKKGKKKGTGAQWQGGKRLPGVHRFLGKRNRGEGELRTSGEVWDGKALQNLLRGEGRERSPAFD